MEAFMEWLQGIDYQTLFATIIAYVTANVGGFIALVIGLLKQRTKNFNYQQLLENAKIELSNENNKRIEDLQLMLYDKLNEVQSNIITNNKEQSQKRIEFMNQIVQDANNVINEVNQLARSVQTNPISLDELEQKLDALINTPKYKWTHAVQPHVVQGSTV